MKKLIFLAVMFSNATFATDWSTGVIDKLRYQETRTLITQVDASNPGGCDNINYIVLKEDGSDFTKRKNAALLAAQMSGKKVSLALSGCSNSGTAGYPVISEVWVTNN
jgi:hypothetical protein